MMKIRLRRGYEKEHWLGQGEWCSEEDLVIFNSNGFECYVIRMMNLEPYALDYMYGGHFCGYITIPMEHRLFAVDYNDIKEDIEVHGGITFSDFSLFLKNKPWQLGFDCAHCDDIVPSMEKTRKELKIERLDDTDIMKDMREKFPDCALFNPSYKNIDFVINELESLAKQL